MSSKLKESLGKSTGDADLARSLLSSTKAIAVTGLENDEGEIDDEVLEEFFGSARFGEPDIVDIRMDKSNGVAYLFFNDTTAIENILKESKYELMGVKLKVSQAADVERPIDKKRILVKGVPPGVTPDELFLFVEAVGKTDSSVVDLVHLSDASSAVLTFAGEINENTFAALSQNASRRALKGNFITVEQVNVTDSVLVKGFAKSSEKKIAERLKLYFGSKKKSKGGPVADVKVQSGGEEAIVSFENCQDAESVLGQDHRIGHNKLEVKPFYRSLGYCGESEPEVKPERWTVDVPCQKPLLHFLNERPQHWEKLNKQLSKSGGSLEGKWFTPEEEVITVQHTRSSSAPKLSHSEWEDQCSKCVSRFLTHFSTMDVSVDPEVWDDVAETCEEKISAKTLDNLQIEYDEEMHVITIIGTTLDVNKAVAVVSKLQKDKVKKHRRKSEDESRTSKTLSGQHIPKLRLLSKNKSVVDIPGVKIDIHPEKAEIVLTGKQQDVMDVQVKVLQVIAAVKERSYHVTESEYSEILSSDGGKAKLKKLLQGKNLEKKVEFEVVGQGHEIAVQFYGMADEDTGEAQALLRQSLKTKTVPVEATRCGFLTRSSWNDTVDQITDKHCVNIKVVELANGKRDVRIYGFENDTLAVAIEVQNFLGQSQVSKDKMKVPVGCAAYMKDHKKADIKKLEKTHSVAITIDDVGGVITIEGPDDQINKVEEHIEQMEKNIHKEQMVIKQPGLAEYMQSSTGKSYLNDLESKKKCKIYAKPSTTGVAPPLPARPRSSSVRSSLAPLSVASLGVPVLPTAGPVGNSYTTAEGIKIVVVEGNIEKEKTDVIVSSSGVVSNAICQAGGADLKKALSDAGDITLDSVKVTDGFDLGCKYVYHTNCPRWSAGKEKDLKFIIVKCLNEAHAQKVSSIAFPTIGAGNLGFPRNIVANVMFEEVINFSKRNSKSLLRVVRFVVFNKDLESIKAYKVALQQAQSGQTGIPGPRAGGTGFTFVSAAGGVVEAEIGNVKIFVKQGDLTKEKVDVIVNTSDANWNFGGLGNYIVQCGGQAIKDECSKISPKKGEIYATGAGTLPFKKIYQFIMPDNTEQISTSVKKCLDLAERNRCKSIGFPGIGTGNANVSPQDSATQIMTGILSFVTQSNPSNITLIHVTIYDQRQISAFQTEVRKLCAASSTVSGASGVTLVPRSGNSVEAQCQGVSIQVQGGDITKDQVDIIVNTADTDFNFGGLGDYLVKLGGTSITDELAKQKGKMKKGDVVVTGPGTLKFKKIYHLVMPTVQQIGTAVQKCLGLAEKYKCRSIAFPAIGTGKAGVATEDSAKEMINDAIAFVKKNSPSNLNCIRITVFDKGQISAFQDELKKAAQPSVRRSVTSLSGRATKIGRRKSIYTRSLGGTVHRLNLEIYGASQSDVGQVTKAIDELSQSQTKTEFLELQGVQHLSQSDHDDIMTFENTYGVGVKIDRNACKITVEGNSSDVTKAIAKIANIVSKKADDKTKLDRAKIMQKKIQWYWVDDEDGREPFETVLNYDVEMAYRAKKPNSIYDIEGSKCTLDFKTMMETDSAGISTHVERVEIDPSLPAHWEANPTTKGEAAPVHSVTLQSGSPEFKDIEDKFHKSFDDNNETRRDIQSIVRVQNPELYKHYKLYNDKLNRENKHSKNERLLFHGTSDGVVDQINHKGFNRSFSGLNVGAIYGRGVYFARDAKYSAQTAYSAPGQDGFQRMYYARVLVGDFAAGNSSIIVPPARDPKTPLVTFNSVVDDVKDPKIFVIFYDAQAYPEYLITFK